MKTFDSNQRLISLDMLRGLTIALMIMVNNPGSWGNLYWPLAHAEWHGVTITDFVFPFFIFIMGVSIVLALNKQIAAGADKKKMKKKILIRSLKIFGLGIFLSLYPYFNFAELRIPGVLQRIAICYFVGGHLFLSTTWKTQLKIAVFALVGYWLAMLLIPVPGLGTGVLEPGKNLAAWIDSLIIPLRMWQGTWDPEGLFSTIPAIVTAITGMLAGHLIKTDMEIHRKLNYLFFAGLCMVVGGYIWDLFFPMNKNLWTSSYVLFTSGWAFMSLAACILIVDVHGYTKIAKFGIVYGSNAISIYVLAGLLPYLLYTVLGVKGFFFDELVNLGVAPKTASALWSVLYVLLLYIPAYIMYKKKIFIKV